MEPTRYVMYQHLTWSGGCVNTTIITLAITFLTAPMVLAGDIHDQAKAGNLSAIEAALAANPAVVDVRDDKGNTPLHSAIIGRQQGVAGLLINAGADLDAVNRNGLTPLLIALDRGRGQLACLLIESGADCQSQAYRDRTMLHLAARSGNTEAARLLIEKGVNVNGRDQDGLTPLHLAARNGKAKVARLLIANGAKIDAVDNEGFTPANLADEHGHDETVRALVEQGVPAGEVSRFRPPKSSPHDYQNGTSALQIPFEVIANAIILPVQLNDSRELHLALDTGMPKQGVLLLRQELGEELGLHYVGRASVSGAGSGESPVVDLARGIKLSLPGIEFDDQRVEVLANAPPASWKDDGVVGLTILGSCVVEVDYDRTVINLYDPEAFSPDSTWEEIPLHFNGRDLPYVDVAVKTAEQGEIKLNLALDTGSGQSLHIFSLSENGPPPPENAIDKILGTGLNGDVHGKLGRILEVRLGSYVLDDVLAAFHDTKLKLGGPRGDKVDGILGNQILRRFNVILDYSHGRMFLKPNKYHDTPFECSMSGLLFRRTETSEHEVFGVVENSPAALAGILEGDIVVTVNGRDVSSYTRDEFFDIFVVEGSTVTLGLLRGTESYQRTLTLRRLL